MAAALVAAAAILWGLWPLWVRGVPAVAAAATAFLVCALAGLPLALVQGRGRTRARGAWWLLAALGLVDGGNVWLYFQALSEGAVAPAVLAHYLAPVMVALAAPRLLGEPRAPRTPLALALALAGTAALVAGEPGGANLRAFAFGSCSAVFYAGSVLLSKKLGDAFATAELLAYHLLVAGVALAAIGGVVIAPKPAIGGLVSGLLAGLLYYAGLRRLPAERAGLLGYLEPPAAVVCGWLAFGEVPGKTALLGGALILTAGMIPSGRPAS